MPNSGLFPGDQRSGAQIRDQRQKEQYWAEMQRLKGELAEASQDEQEGDSE